MARPPAGTVAMALWCRTIDPRPSRARVRVPRRKRGRPAIYLASSFDDEGPELVAIARAIVVRTVGR